MIGNIKGAVTETFIKELRLILKNGAMKKGI